MNTAINEPLVEGKPKKDEFNIDHSLINGPCKDRKCTDIFFLLVWTAFCITCIVTAFYGYAAGEPRKLLAPMDGAGNFCGFDSN